MLSLFKKEQEKYVREYFSELKDFEFFSLACEKDIFKGEHIFQVHEKYDYVFHIDDFSEKSKELISFWVGHNHFRYKKSFEEIFCEIKYSLESSYETEKKFLIKYPDVSYLKSLKNARTVEIEQAYIFENEEKYRVRKRGFLGFYSYYKTVKKNVGGIKKEEKEWKISKEEYEEKIKGENCLKISKTRYCLCENHTYYEIDVYPFWNDKATLEIELKHENEDYTLPKNIEIIQDVSADKEYSNFNLSKKYK